MAVTQPLAWSHQLGAGNGELTLFSNVHEQVGQFQTDKDIFRSEVLHVLEILVRNNHLTQMDVMPRPASTHDTVSVDNAQYFNRCKEQCEERRDDDEGDGGHRCPYFPCPYCHRSRSMFVPESNTALIKTYHCGKDEVDLHKKIQFEIGFKAVANDSHEPYKKPEANEQVVTTTNWDGEGDGGHRCPYFPCPDCHRTRSIFIPELTSEYCKISIPSLDCKSNSGKISHVDCVKELPLKIRSDGQSGIPELNLMCPDKAHTCPYFPCPICHRTR